MSILHLVAQTHAQTHTGNDGSLILQLSALLASIAAMLTLLYQAVRNRKISQTKIVTNAERAATAASRTIIEANKSAVDIYGQLVHELRVEVTALTGRVDKCEAQRAEQAAALVRQESEISSLRREVAFVKGIQTKD